MFWTASKSNLFSFGAEIRFWKLLFLRVCAMFLLCFAARPFENVHGNAAAGLLLKARWDEMRWEWNEIRNEMRWDQMSQMRWSELRWDEMRWEQIRSGDENQDMRMRRWEAGVVRWDDMRRHERTWDEMRQNYMRWHEMKSNEMKSDEMKSNEMRWNGIWWEWDEVMTGKDWFSKPCAMQNLAETMLTCNINAYNCIKKRLLFCLFSFYTFSDFLIFETSPTGVQHYSIFSIYHIVIHNIRSKNQLEVSNNVLIILSQKSSSTR